MLVIFTKLYNAPNTILQVLPLGPKENFRLRVPRISSSSFNKFNLIRSVIHWRVNSIARKRQAQRIIATDRNPNMSFELFAAEWCDNGIKARSESRNFRFYFTRLLRHVTREFLVQTCYRFLPSGGLMRKFLAATNGFLLLMFTAGDFVRRSFIFRSASNANFHIEALTTEVQAAERR